MVLSLDSINQYSESVSDLVIEEFPPDSGVRFTPTNFACLLSVDFHADLLVDYLNSSTSKILDSI